MSIDSQPVRWLRRFYHRIIQFSQTSSALAVLTVVTFFNSSFFPIPQDAFLLPMLVARPERAFFYGTLCTVVSCLGGVLGYLIGMLFYDTIGQEIIAFYGYDDAVEDIKSAFTRYGWLIIIIAGITPFPYKIITITCGFLGYAMLPFIVSSLCGRAIRFYFYAIVFTIYGPQINHIIERWFGWVAVAGLAILGVVFYILFRGALV